jgi:hypothetical protein
MSIGSKKTYIQVSLASCILWLANPKLNKTNKYLKTIIEATIIMLSKSNKFKISNIKNNT